MPSISKLAIIATIAACGAATAQTNKQNSDASNQKQPQQPLVERSYPLKSEADREKTAKAMQQLVVDLLATFNNYKEVHWDLNGPLYLVLHEFYQSQADYYRMKSDVFAERALHVGYTIDGRYTTIARTTTLPPLPAGIITDNESLKLQIDRVTILQKEVYDDIDALEKSDPVTANQLQDLAYGIDKNLWQMRVHLSKPGSLGEDLPWAAQQGHNYPGAASGK